MKIFIILSVMFVGSAMCALEASENDWICSAPEMIGFLAEFVRTNGPDELIETHLTGCGKALVLFAYSDQNQAVCNDANKDPKAFHRNYICSDPANLAFTTSATADSIPECKEEFANTAALQASFDKVCAQLDKPVECVNPVET